MNLIVSLNYGVLQVSDNLLLLFQLITNSFLGFLQQTLFNLLVRFFHLFILCPLLLELGSQLVQEHNRIIEANDLRGLPFLLVVLGVLLLRYLIWLLNLITVSVLRNWLLVLVILRPCLVVSWLFQIAVRLIHIRDLRVLRLNH